MVLNVFDDTCTHRITYLKLLTLTASGCDKIRSGQEGRQGGVMRGAVELTDDVRDAGAGARLWPAAQCPRGGAGAPVEATAADAPAADAAAATDHTRSADTRYHQQPYLLMERGSS